MNLIEWVQLQLVLPQPRTLAVDERTKYIHINYFSVVSIYKYLLTVGLLEQNINVTQLWLDILKFSSKF